MSLIMKRGAAPFRSRSFRVAVLVFLAASPGCRHAAVPGEEARPAPVRAVRAERVTVGQWTELLGATQAPPGRRALITSPIEGRVVALPDGEGSGLAEGDPVTAGQVIARLDDRIARANREKAAAALTELDEQKRQADYALDLARIDIRRFEALGKGGGGANQVQLVSPIELERARIALGDAQSKQKAVTARREAIDADLRAIDEQLELYALRAPIAGRLGILEVVVGQTLSPGTPIAEVVDLDDIDVLAFAPPHTVAALAMGQEVRLVAGPPQPAAATSARGKLVFIASEAQSDTGSYAVKVRFPNRDLGLRGNRVVHVQVLTQPEKERLTIPDAALLEDQEPPAVVLVESLAAETDSKGNEETVGTVHRVQAELGVRDRDRHIAEVLGLRDPETHAAANPEQAWFAVAGSHGLENGDRVRLVTEHEAEQEPQGSKSE